MPTTLIQRLIDEERHLEGIARDGFMPATLPIMFGGIVLAVFSVVGLALALTLVVSNLV
jgi:hypothetical protein